MNLDPGWGSASWKAGAMGEGRVGVRTRVGVWFICTIRTNLTEEEDVCGHDGSDTTREPPPVPAIRPSFTPKVAR